MSIKDTKMQEMFNKKIYKPLVISGSKVQKKKTRIHIMYAHTQRFD